MNEYERLLEQERALHNLRRAVAVVDSHTRLLDDATRARSEATLVASDSGLSGADIQVAVPEIGTAMTVSRDIAAGGPRGVDGQSLSDSSRSAD